MPKKYDKSNAKTYEQQWDVPSDSNPASYYTVSLTQEGQLICHCWPFLRDRQPCKHIRKVQAGKIAPRGQTLPAPPPTAVPIAGSELQIVLANVRCVTPVAEKAEAVITAVKVPEIPRGNEHFLLTVLYDLARLGINWPTLVARYRLSSDLTIAWVEQYITEYGRLIYGPLQDGRFQGMEYIPPEGV